MVDDVGAAQARALLRELHRHVDDISHQLEAADDRNRYAHQRGISRRDPSAGILRRDLYEVHRLIDGLHRRYPETAERLHALSYEPASRGGRAVHTNAAPPSSAQRFTTRGAVSHPT